MNKFVPVLVGLMLVAGVVALTVACGGPRGAMEAPESVYIDCDEFMKQSHIAKEVELAVGGSLEVLLCSNPTTGFRWGSVKIEDETIIKEVTHDLRPADGKGNVGSAGTQVWTFEALHRGATKVSMEYSRPWEGGERGEWTFNLSVLVR